MISKVLALLAAVLVTAFTGPAIHGCLDVVAIRVDERDAGPTHDLDAPSDGPRPCEVCIRAEADPGPGCADVVAVCDADPACKGTMDCAISIGCLELTGQGNIIDCGTPCGRDAGLDLTSPSITYVLAVVACGQDVCGPICRGEVSPPPVSRAR